MSSVGGLLGLIAGMSAISFIEFIYHFIRALTKKLFVKVHPKAPERVFPRQCFVANNETFKRQFTKIIDEYSKKSNIHGLQYTNDKQLSLFEKSFWVICVFSSTVICTLVVHETIQRAKLNSIVTAIDSKTWTTKDVSDDIN